MKMNCFFKWPGPDFNLRVSLAGLAMLLIIPLTACATADAQEAPAITLTAPQAKAPAGPIKVDPGILLKFVRTTIIALDQANKTGNYSVLHDLGSPFFQKANPPERLAEIFAAERQARYDLSNAAILDPVLTLQPEINADGLLHFGGYFPAGEAQLRFELLFQAVGPSWRLFGLSISLSDAASPAQSMNAPTPAPPPAKAATPAPAAGTPGK